MEIPRRSSLRYFVLTVQPFGLSSAPYIFIECLKPLEKYKKVNGVNIALLLDDGWLIDIDRNSRRWGGWGGWGGLHRGLLCR